MSYDLEGFKLDVNGKRYVVDVDDNRDDDETSKRSITVIMPDGKKVMVDWTPYTDFTKANFKLWLQLGMPDRKTIKSIAPLNAKDLEALAKEKNVK